MTSIFTRILKKEIPSEILYETGSVFVIKDIKPEAKTHLLIIPKKEIVSISDLDETNKDIMGDMFLVATFMAKKLGIEEGYRLRVNAGDYQEVPHIHMHLLSKR